MFERIKKNKQIFILLGLAAIICLIYFKVNFNGMVIPDAMHFANIARNVVRGNGMMTDDVMVGEIALLKNDVFRGSRNAPLHPLVMAGFFSLFGISDFSAAMSSAWFYLLSVPMVFLLARRLFNNKIAWFASLLFMVDSKILYYSISGLTEPIFIFLLLFAFYVLSESSGPKQFFFAGAVLGLARLVKIHAVFFLIPFLLYAWLFEKKSGLRNTLSMLAGFVVLSVPEIIRGYVIFGDPIFSGYSMGIYHFKYSSDQLAGSLTAGSLPNWWQTIFGNLPSFVKHYLSNLDRHYHLFVLSLKPFLMAFFIAGVLRWYADRKLNLLKTTLFLSIGIELLALSVSTQPERYFHYFIPFMLIFSLEFMVDLFFRIQFKSGLIRAAAAGGMVVFLCYSFVLNFHMVLQADGLGSRKTGFDLARQILRKHTRPGDIILSDFSELSWPADRKMITLPLGFDGLKQVESRVEISAIMLTNTRQGKLKIFEGDFMKDWRDALDNPPKRIGRYHLAGIFTDKNEKAVLYKK